jgi:hypothetical protein
MILLAAASHSTLNVTPAAQLIVHIQDLDYGYSTRNEPSQDLRKTRSRPGRGVKALRRICDGESDQLAVTSVHETLSGLIRRSGRDDVRGVGDASGSVRAHRFKAFYSRFAPGVAPDSRSTSIALDPSLY